MAPQALRRAAFQNAELSGPLSTLLDKLVRHAQNITEADFDTLIAADFSEDQVFEFVVCGAVGEAIRQYTTALEALEAATQKGNERALGNSQ
jgi:alkylhydroperoxidase family enzyme